MESAPKDQVEYWKYVIEEQKASGLSKAKFCDENDIKRQSFFKWQKHFQEQDNNDTGSFIEAEVTATKDISSGLCLKLANGLSLGLDPDFDDHTLKRFLRVAALV